MRLGSGEAEHQRNTNRAINRCWHALLLGISNDQFPPVGEACGGRRGTS
jgi:hypothetical protein